MTWAFLILRGIGLEKRLVAYRKGFEGFVLINFKIKVGAPEIFFFSFSKGASKSQSKA
jgi:hypothetical protein